MPDTTHDIPRLEKQITALSDALAHLGKGESLRDLIRIIHFPGFTTPAEFILLASIVENMTQQTAALTHMQDQLVRGAKAVVGEKAVVGT